MVADDTSRYMDENKARAMIEEVRIKYNDLVSYVNDDDTNDGEERDEEDILYNEWLLQNLTEKMIYKTIAKYLCEE